jgi:hypothetical protein
MNELTTKVEQINLDGHQVLRLTRGPYLLGYFPNADRLIAALPGLGLRPSDVKIDVTGRES